MTVTQPLANPSPSTREDSRGFTEHSVSERIRILASQGLKVRDISSMLHIHPQMVLLMLDAPTEVTR